MANILFIVALIAFCNIQNIIGNHLGNCIQENPCVCRFNDYSLINITTIIGDQKPPYLVDTDPTTNSTYYFSGCKDATFTNQTFSVSMISVISE